VRVSLFFEIPVPRPWDEHSEQRAFANYLDALELADKSGFHTAWTTEHHFLEEYSHASAPEIFLAAASQRTERIRLGHGIVHLPPAINHPARTAERVATLDLISNGRVELGTGESSSVGELGGFMVDPGKKREQWFEALEVLTGCLADTPFAGFDGEYVTMPARNVVPKPLQQPHPPVWVSATRRSTVDLAARSGIGCLSFAVMGPDAFREVVEEYYEKITDDSMVPLTRSVNPNLLALCGTMICASTDEEGDRLLGHNARRFNYGVGHYYGMWGSMHRPGVTNLNDLYTQGMADDTIPGDSVKERAMIGSPEKLRQHLRAFEDTGVDEVLLLLPEIEHEHIMESLELFGRTVLPEFVERDEIKQKEKAERFAPIIDAAMKRRPPSRVVDPTYEFGGIATSWDLQTPIQEIVEAVGQRSVDPKYAERGIGYVPTQDD